MARIKGIGLLHVVKMLRSMREAALGVVPAPLHHYLSQEISRSEWYPFEEYLALLHGLAKLMPPDTGDAWEMFGRLAIRSEPSRCAPPRRRGSASSAPASRRASPAAAAGERARERAANHGADMGADMGAAMGSGPDRRPHSGRSRA